MPGIRWINAWRQMGISPSAEKYSSGTRAVTERKSLVVLFRARSLGGRCDRPGLKRISALWLSSRIDIAASVISASLCRMRRNTVELLAVSALRPGDSIELGQTLVVAKQRLQVRRLSCRQLHLRIQHVKLRAGTCI